MPPFYIITTRFTNQTWIENKKWRENNNWDGCIYGVPTKLPEYSKIPKNALCIFVLEMNNDLNRLEGIGIIMNKARREKIKIHSDNRFNKKIYRSYYRLNRDKINTKSINLLESILFNGKSHLKRGYGFTSIRINWKIKNGRLLWFPIQTNIFDNILESYNIPYKYQYKFYTKDKYLVALHNVQFKIIEFFLNLKRKFKREASRG